VRQNLADWIAAERGRFFLLLPVAMGAAICGYFSLPDEPPLWLGIALAGTAAVALAACWPLPVARFLAALALAASLGFARAEWRTAAMPPMIAVPDRPVALTGTIARIELLPGARRVTLSGPRLAGGTVLPRAIRLRLRPGDPAPLVPGDTIAAYARLFTPERPAYPGAWDAARQDFFSRLGASGFAFEPVRVLRRAAPGSLAERLQRLRSSIASRILAVLPVATGSVAVTLLTGDEQAIPPPERAAFIAAGLAHILAVAGLHVGIVMGLAFFASRFLLTRPERLALRLPVKSIAALAALAAGAGYAALTGAHLPILRSLAMASLVTLGVLAGRRAISLRGLALAAMAILLATPEAVTTVSFQMSFSAVLGLIAGFAAVPARAHRAEGWRRLPHHVAALALTSLLAGGASMPFAAYQFQQVQPYWIPANLVAVPLTAFWILPLGLLALALMPFGLAAAALVPMGWGIAVMLWLATRIAGWPAAMLRIPPMPDAAIGLIACGLIWLCIWRSRPRLAGIPLILAGLAFYAAVRPPDVLVSPDAKLIAIRDGGRVWLLRQPGASSYTLAQWAPVWAGLPIVPAQCSAATCRIGPVLLVTAQRLAMTPMDCAGVAVLVSPALRRGGCTGLPMLDRRAAYEHGALAAWVGQGRLRLLTDREVQGNRPWVPPWPKATTLR
jgi:competence protein ComEC